ncbi:hypothetical protein FZEAL_6064 [Fusarium zealandicum]|uniref:Aminoglycoside phosphotransferase domain-containing protein n=1 Tax=Fusarium zealandicum TaxID=1053134 RepID=A0A8H4UIF9_9HYPO|nr:hypothetical protein FZEAL_6064 [Fusarium zealandicum]
MSLSVLGTDVPPTACVEMMNPERAQMLAEAAEEEASKPAPVVKIESSPPLPASGANCNPVGDASLRASRALQDNQRRKGVQSTPDASGQGSALPLKPTTALMQHGETLAALFTPSSSISLKRPLSAVDGGAKNGKGKNRKAQKGLYYTKVLSLGPAPVPDQDTKYLMSLLRNRTLTLCLQPYVKKGCVSVVKTYDFRISQAGLVLHETLSPLGHTRAFPLSLHDADISASDGTISRIVRGELLEDIWPSLNKQLKYQFARQLRTLLNKMRSTATGHKTRVGSVHSGPYSLFLDKHAEHTYYAIRRQPGQNEFMALLMSTLYDTVPMEVAQALISQFRTDYRTVLTHGALCPRNIVVCNDAITWILGWDCAGDYPAWWEYARFFEARTSDANRDWYSYAADIFDDVYPAELAVYQGLARCQQP